MKILVVVERFAVFGLMVCTDTIRYNNLHCMPKISGCFKPNNAFREHWRVKFESIDLSRFPQRKVAKSQQVTIRVDLQWHLSRMPGGTSLGILAIDVALDLHLENWLGQQDVIIKRENKAIKTIHTYSSEIMKSTILYLLVASSLAASTHGEHNL